MGIASTPLWTKGYAAVESEATVERGTCNITLMSIGLGFKDFNFKPNFKPSISNLVFCES